MSPQTMTKNLYCTLRLIRSSNHFTRYLFSRTIHSSASLRLRGRRFPIETEDSKSLDTTRKGITMIEPVIAPPQFGVQLKEVLERNEKLFLKYASHQKSRKLREKKNTIFLEGVSLIRTASMSGIKLDSVFYSKDDMLQSVESHFGELCDTYKVTDKILRTLCGVRSSPGIIGVCKKPTIEITKSLLPITVLCSNVRDSENLGLLIAIAAAAGCRSVLLTKGCADPWDRKALVSAEGGHFHISISNNIDWADLANHIPSNSAFYIAEGSGDIDIDDLQIHSVDYNEGTGSETHINYLQTPGASVPKQMTDNQLQEYDETPSVLTHLYSAITFPQKHLVVCIGGETNGIDSRIEKLGEELNAQKLKIPLENGMDSLNVCSALSVLLFEIKRQFSNNVISKCN